MPSYERPRTLAAALHALAAGARPVVAGGTDFYPARVGRPVEPGLLDISRVEELQGLQRLPGHWRLGAALTWSELARTALPSAFDALRQAAREVGGVQVQNAGTLGGNLCNGSPAADGVPPLLALDARVELTSLQGTRALPLGEFLLGPRRTALATGELLSAVIVPEAAVRGASAFVKLGARRHLVISIVMAAACLEADADGRVVSARVAVGACSPVARRLGALEAGLLGRPLGSGLGSLVHPAHLAGLDPIDDVRASRDYRLDAARGLVARLLTDLEARL